MSNAPSIKTANQTLIEHFLDTCWMEKGLAQNTLNAYRSDLQHFCQWLPAPRLLAETQKQDILQYLSERIQGGVSAQTMTRMLSSLRRFFQHLCQQGIRRDDPSELIDRPKPGRPLPHSLSENDVENLLNAPDTNTCLGLRDKAMLELLYASGLRVSELTGLKHYQLDIAQGFVRIVGKGSKERLVPIGEEATGWLNRYLESRDGREQLLAGRTSDRVFLTRSGTGMTRQAFWYLIKKYALQADIRKTVSPHTLRHAFATHLLNHGADLRVLQILLGHSNVSTTQIYTHVATQEIQSIHAKHHPRG